jgi:NADPH:quinone reductase-like Zn-dependent oxidoreductase
MRRVFYVGPAEDPSATVAVHEVPDPACPEAGVVVAVAARPINPADLLLLEGRHVYTPELPSPVGIEGAGRVIAAGPASRLAVGTLVAIPRGGTWSEQLALGDADVIPLPDDVDIEQAAMLSVNPFTAVGLLEGLPEGATLALNAGNAAISRLVLALARRRGLRAVAVVRDLSVAPVLLALGAAAVVADGEGLAARLRDAAGAPIVRGLDAVAGVASGQLFDAVADGGELIVYGLLSSDRVSLPAANLVFRDVVVRGYSRLRCYAALTPERRKEIGAELVHLLRTGAAVTEIEARYPLSQVRAAVAHHQRPGRRGKILLLSPEG